MSILMMDISQSNILTTFFNVSRKQPASIAIQDEGHKLSYEELDSASFAVGARLAQLGISRGHVVPVISQSCLHMVIGILGVLRAGATYVPLDRSQWPLTKIKSIISRIHPRIALYTGFNPDLGPDILAISVETAMKRWRKVARLSSKASIANIRPEDNVSVIFTSGTTGEPKGVMVRHSSLYHFVTTSPFNYDIMSQDRVLLVLSCAFDACMATLFSVLCNGGCIVIADGLSFQERVRQCTVFVGTPSILEALDPPKSASDYPLLNRLYLGGETPTHELLKRWAIINKPIWIAYGPTEATCATLMGKIASSMTSEPSDPRILGFPIAGSTITVVNKDLNPITALYEEGELLISGPGLAKGYWGNERLTEERFIIFQKKRTYRTGDYVKWVIDIHGNRTIYFCGRKDRTVKLRGFLVNLDTDVDAAIMKNIQDVKGIYSFKEGDHVFTAVRPAVLDEALLLAQTRSFLPQYMLPERIVAMDRFPTNAYGKTDYRKLQIVVSQRLQIEQTKPRETPNLSQLEIDLFSGLKEVLGVAKSHIKSELSFIGNGMYSLTAVRLSSYLQQRGYPFRPHDFLSSSPIEIFIQAHRTLNPDGQVDEPQKPPITDTALPTSPLTPQQLHLVLGTLKNPHFNVVNYVLECDSHHLHRLKSAWKMLERTEPIFRTTIEVRDEQYIQRLRDAPCSIWADDKLDGRGFEEKLVTIAANTGLGHRFTVVPLQETGKTALVWSVHHALMDGFSSGLLLDKLKLALRGDAITPSTSFPQAMRSLQASTERRQPASKQFWEDQEKLIPEARGELPVPEPQRSNESNGSNPLMTHQEHWIDFDPSTAEEVARYCTRQNVTPAAIHYAVWSLILSTYTGSANVIFGAVISGRDRDDCSADSLIGCLLDTLPFRNKIDRGTTSSEFVRTTHKLVHRVSHFHGSSDNGGQISYSTALSCDPDLPESDLAHLGFSTSSRVIQHPDLPLIVRVQQDGCISLRYKTEKYRQDDIADLAHLYKNIFLGILAPRVTIQDILHQKFSKEHQDSILTLGNFHSEESYGNSVPESVTIAALFNESAARYSHAIALEKGDTQMTYAQVKRDVEHLAGFLQSKVRPGDTVCVLADRSISWIIGIFAVLLVSAVYCPVDVGQPQIHQERIIHHSNAKLVLCDRIEQLQSIPSNGIPTIAISQVLESDLATYELSRTARSNMSSADAAFLVFTSGSTGVPKGILIGNRSLVAVRSSYNALFKNHPGSRIAQFLSPGFDVAIQEIVWSLTTGGTLVLRKDEENPFSHILDVDTIMMTPSVAANLDPSEYPNLRFIHLAGEPVPERVVKLWDTPGREIYNIYGPAEATIVNCSQRLKASEVVSVGYPLPSSRVYILNDHLELLPPMVIGNIYVAGIQVSLGYINNESKTKSSFIPDQFTLSRPSQERMYYSGDLGYMTRDGRVRFCGRKDRQIKLRGFRTNLDDVANTARTLLFSLKKAFVTERNGRLVLWAEPEDLDTAKLRELLATTLPVHALPSHIIALKRLPLNPNGKIDSRKLETMELPSTRGTISPGTSQLSQEESVIAEEWRSLLGLKHTALISPYDSFLGMGGHSVLQLALAARLKQKFGVPVTVKDVILAPTLGKLASVMREKQQTQLHDDEQQIGEGSALGQQRLSPPELEWWCRYQSAEQLSAFNVPFVANLSPDMDLHKMKDSIELALARHDVLRSRFISGGQDEEPRRTLSQSAITVHMAGEDFDLLEFLNQPFDVSHDSLVRVALTPSLVAFSVSHMIIDLTALRYLLADIEMIHKAKPGTKLPRPRQYFEVQQWNSPVDQASVSFWQPYLEGAQVHKRKKQKRSYRGSSLFADLPSQTYQRMLVRAADLRLSLHQFALSAAGLVLHALAGRVPVVVGSPYLNRTLERDQSVVGLFLEPLPIRIDFASCSSDSDSAALLQATKASSQSALAHAVPWPALLHALQLPFPSALQQVFDVVVTLHDDRDARQLALAIPGESAAPTAMLQRAWPQGAKFPLCFEFQAGADLLTVRLEYDSDLLQQAHARVLHALLLAAANGLGEERATYADIVQGIDQALRLACAEEGIDLEELPRIARQCLV